MAGENIQERRPPGARTACGVVVVDRSVPADPSVLCRAAGIDPVPPVVVVHRRGGGTVVHVDLEKLQLGLIGTVVARSHHAAAEGELRTDDGRIVVDLGAQTVQVAGELVALRRREYELLCYLMERPGEVITRTRLLTDLWGFAGGSSKTVTVHVRQLRHHLELDPARPRHLCTVRGFGYRFAP